MRYLAAIVIAVMLFSRTTRAEDSLPKQYLAAYTAINEAEHEEKSGDYQTSLATFLNVDQQLMAIQQAHPDWETALVDHRLDDCRTKIIELQSKIFALAAKNQPAANGSIAPAAKGPAPSAVTEQQVDAWMETQMSQMKARSKSWAANADKYPWKTGVTPSMFWIGEDGAGNSASAWNASWVKTNGGADSPADRSGYGSGDHASRVNPFYVALPFNDLANPNDAKKWLPAGWTHLVGTDGQPVSACKDRWVEIKNSRGDTCYAQWEDVGPEGNDDGGYVFGAEKPKHQPAIDVSPAVAAYLGLQQNDNKTVSWRFVDEQNVRPGAWLKLDEQAILFRAMHGMKE